jgi:threonyl-tRNA synthetase
MNDSVGKSFALSTVQIDVENTQSFDITYIDEKGKARYPLLLHTSISGGIDRCICAILEKEGKKIKKGKKGMLPLWLSPTHIRLLPISPEYLPDCLELAKKVKGRVDIDDRDASISKKIRDAEKEWIPIIIVYGENERESYIFKPRYRFPFEKANITLEELNNLIEGEIRTFPFEHLPLPQLLSKRPRFR